VFSSSNVRLVPLAVFVFILAACDGSKEAVSKPAQSSTPVPSSASEEKAKTQGCERLGALRAAFPEASALPFAERESIKPLGERGTAWPGRCGAWWTAYSFGPTEVEITMTLYKTHKQALTALAEPAYGPVEKLSTGALVRTYRGVAGVAGVMKRDWAVASVYRNVFSISSSIADKPIPLSAQLTIHRIIDEGVLALE
jgi:hypothetical protein